MGNNYRKPNYPENENIALMPKKYAKVCVFNLRRSFFLRGANSSISRSLAFLYQGGLLSDSAEPPITRIIRIRYHLLTELFPLYEYNVPHPRNIEAESPESGNNHIWPPLVAPGFDGHHLENPKAANGVNHKTKI